MRPFRVLPPFLVLALFAGVFWLHWHGHDRYSALPILLFGVCGSIWLAVRALHGGSASVYPYLQAYRSRDARRFWLIIAFYALAGLLCGLLFVAVLYPGPFQPVLRALSWQPPQKGFLKAPLGFDISAPRL